MKIKMMGVNDVHPYELNVKKHDQAQIERIGHSIKQFGFDQPVVVDKNHVIIKGHGRRMGAMHIGLTEIPVLVRDDLTDEQVRAARLADNRVALGDIDTDMFREELSTLNYDMVGLFDAKEIDFSMVDLGAMVDTSIVYDLSAAVDAQEEATVAKVEEIKGKRIQLYKVLGFKDVAGADQIHLTRFMALVEEQTGLKGDLAFVAFCKQVAA
jgi:ParB/RepB/Spo0J family partition protein